MLAWARLRETAAQEWMGSGAFRLSWAPAIAGNRRRALAKRRGWLSHGLGGDVQDQPEEQQPAHQLIGAKALEAVAGILGAECADLPGELQAHTHEGEEEGEPCPRGGTCQSPQPDGGSIK